MNLYRVLGILFLLLSAYSIIQLKFIGDIFGPYENTSLSVVALFVSFSCLFLSSAFLLYSYRKRK